MTWISFLKADYVALRQEYAGGRDPFATLRETIRIALTGTGTGYMKSPNVTHLKEQSRVYADSYISSRARSWMEGYVYIDGENMCPPRPHSLVRIVRRSEELDEDVQQMFENVMLATTRLSYDSDHKASQEVGSRTAAV
jgi:hypothetical protein